LFSTFFWIFAIAFAVAATFAWVLVRGLRSGVLPQYRGGWVVRERNPGWYWITAAIYALGALGIAAIPIWSLWRYLGLN
jgi:hypothetical protein